MSPRASFGCALLLLAACSHHTTSGGDGAVAQDAAVSPGGDGGQLPVGDGGDVTYDLGSSDPDAYNLGINVPALTYYAGFGLYADVALAVSGNNGPWDAKSGGGAAALDATGAPTVQAQAFFPSDYPSGDYAMTWDGTGSIVVNSGATLGPVTTTTSGSTQHNTATLTLTTAPNQFVQLQSNPPVTNFHLMAPADQTVGMFIKPFLDRMQPFSTLRFMDPLNTNNNTVENWSQRTWPSAGSRGGTQQGIAYEDIIALANQTHKDVWINVPVLATDDYVCRLARLFHYGEQGDKSDSACDPTAPAGTATTATLNAQSHLYVEFTNEIWNSGFQQWEDIYCMVAGTTDSSGKTCDVTAPTSKLAAAELAKTSLPWDESNKYNKASQLSIVLAKRVSDLFGQVFGSGSTQVRHVYNVQSAYTASADESFAFLNAAYGASASYFYAIAVAPYFNIDSDSNAGSVDDIFTDLQTVLATAPPSSDGNAIANWLNIDVAAAQKYKLPLVAYEGGQGISGATDQANKVSAQTDPRMYADYLQYFALWDSLVGRKQLFIHYSYESAPGQYGSWGALSSQASPGSQKWNALMSLTRLAGDADLDGSVTAADCAIVKSNQGMSGLFWEQGDFNDDGKVDATDLAALNTGYPAHDCM